MLSRLEGLISKRWDPRPIAVARVFVGAAGLLIALNTRTHLYGFLTSLQAPAFRWLPRLSPVVIETVTAVWILSAIAMIIGVWARMPAVVVAVCAIAAALLDLQTFSNHTTLLIALCLLLALSSASATWSIDAQFRSRSRTYVEYWPIFLIKFQISTMYGYTALAKLNDSFLSGEVLDGSLRGLGLLEDVGFRDVGLQLVIWTTIMSELFLALGLWHRRTRGIAALVGVALHVGIVLGLPAYTADLIPFGLLAVGPYVLFLSWPGSVRSPLSNWLRTSHAPTQYETHTTMHLPE